MAEQKPKFSKEYQEQEEKNRQEGVVQQNAEEAKKTIIFIHQAKRGQIANFIKEEHSGGRIIRSEEPLNFYGHLLTTSDPDIIDFVRKSPSYKAGIINECADVEEAQIKVRAMDSTRGGNHEIQTVVDIREKVKKGETVGAE